MTSSILHELADKVEAASGGVQWDMLTATFKAIHGEKPSSGSPELAAWLAVYAPFLNMLRANAYESAALRLIPKGWALFHLAGPFNNNASKATVAGGMPVRFMEASAATPALAISAACLRALSSQQGDKP